MVVSWLLREGPSFSARRNGGTSEKKCEKIGNVDPVKRPHLVFLKSLIELTTQE